MTEKLSFHFIDVKGYPLDSMSLYRNQYKMCVCMYIFVYTEI